MGSFSWQHWLIVLLVVVVLFGKGKVSDFMGDVAKGIKAFKKGLADEPETDKAAESEKKEEPPKRIEHMQSEEKTQITETEKQTEKTSSDT